MNTWLVSFQAEWQGACSEEHLLIHAHDAAQAEAGCRHIGRTWLRGEVSETDDCYWSFGVNDVWLKNLRMLSQTDVAVLTTLAFLDEWKVTDSEDALIVCDRNGNRWEDFRD